MSVHQAHVEDAHYWRKRAEERDAYKKALEVIDARYPAPTDSTRLHPDCARALGVKDYDGSCAGCIARAAFGVSETTKEAE